MKPRLFSAMLLLLLLTSCGTPATGNLAGTVTMFPEPVKNEYVFAVDINESDLIKNASKAFCEYVTSATGGVMTLSVSEANDAITEISDGRSHFAFATHEQIQDGGELSILNAPFTYHSYTHFTMSVNSKELLAIVSDHLAQSYHAKPLAGFYISANHLFSSVPLEDAAAFRELSAAAEKSVAVFMPGSKLQEGFANLGFLTETEVSPETRLRLLSEGQALIAEFSTAEAPFLNNSIDDSLYFINSMHSVDMKWLIASTEIWDALSSSSRAVLMEGVGRLFPLIDENNQLRETMLRRNLSQRGIPTLTLPETVSQACLTTWQEGLEPNLLRDHIAAIIKGINPPVS